MYSLCTAFSATPLYLYVMRPFPKPFPKIIRLLSSLCLLLVSTNAFSQACDPFLVEVGGGSYINEISWEILNSDGDVVADGQYDGVSIVCLDADDCLTLNLFDTFGDGWNGNTIVIGDLFSGTLPGGSAGTFDIGNCQPQECLDSLVEVAWENPDSIPGLGFSIQTPDGNGVLTGDGFFQGYTCLDLQACYDVVLSNGLSSSGNGYNATLTIGDSSFVWSGGWSVEFPLAIGCDNTGCTNQEACNYDENVTGEDGSCVFQDQCGVCDGDNSSCTGCVDETACNYDPEAIVSDPATCIFQDECSVCGGDNSSCTGCDDPLACNYDPEAIILASFVCTYPVIEGVDCDGNVTDGSECPAESGSALLVEVGGGSYISEISWEILNSDGDVVADGQYDGVSIVCLDADDCLTLNLFDTFGDGWNGNTIVIGDLFSGTLPGGSAGTFDIGNCQPQECLDSLLEVAWENPDSIPGLGFSIQTPDGNGVLTGDGFFQGYTCLDLQACYDVVLSNGLSSSGNGYNATLTIGDSSFVWSGGWSVEFPLAIGCDNTDAQIRRLATTTKTSLGRMGRVCFRTSAESVTETTARAQGASMKQHATMTRKPSCPTPRPAFFKMSAVYVADNSSCTGCDDPLACNYDPEAIILASFVCTYPVIEGVDCDGNVTDGSECPAESGSALLVEVGGGSYISEISWEILNSDGDVVADGQYDGVSIVCLDADDCLTLNLFDTFGDGWNGNTIVIGDLFSGTCGGSAGTFDIGNCQPQECLDSLVEVAWENPDSIPGLGFLHPNPRRKWGLDRRWVFPRLRLPRPSGMLRCRLVKWAVVVRQWIQCNLDHRGSSFVWSGGWSVEFPLAIGCDNTGCTNQEACNYDENVTGEDGSCVFQDQCGVCDGDNSSCTGCVDETACNYDPEAIVSDPATCIFQDECSVCGGDNSSCTGCDDPLACNYDPEAIILASFVCTYPVIEGVDCDGNFIEGCTYDTAINYNPLAVIEDGSCEFFPAECLAYGCTYMGACNYDAQATGDDGSCMFAENGVDCAGFTVDPVAQAHIGTKSKPYASRPCLPT